MIERGQTPSGFLKHAQEFLAAADLVLNRARSVSLPAYFLLGRSIELSLKAFLLHRGVPLTELRKKQFGHNLRALLDASRQHGIEQHVPLVSIEAGVIQLLSFDYDGKRLEYRVTGGTYHLPLIDVTSEVARKLAFELESILSNEVPH